MDSNQKTKVIIKQEMPPPTILPNWRRESSFIIKWPGLPKIDLNKTDETRTEEKNRACQVEPFTTIKMPNEMLEDPNDYSLVYEDGLLSIESMQTAVADTQLSKIIYTSPNRNRKRYRTVTKPKKMEPASNETIIIERPRLLNETIVLPKEPPKDKVQNESFTLTLKNNIIKDIMTDDDGSPIAEKAILKKNIPLKRKQAFSDYEYSSVKKRVKEFEQLSSIPSMIKTKICKFKEDEEKQNMQEEANQRVAKQETSGATELETIGTIK